MAGEEVKIIADHNNVLIVENKNGQRFTVKTDDVIYTAVQLIDMLQTPIEEQKKEDIVVPGRRARSMSKTKEQQLQKSLF